VTGYQVPVATSLEWEFLWYHFDFISNGCYATNLSDVRLFSIILVVILER